MLRRFGSLLLAAGLMLASPACSGGAKDSPGSKARTSAASIGDAPQSETDSEAESEDESGDTEEPPTPAAAEVIEINAPTATRDRSIVPAKSIDLSPASVTWREVASFTNGLEFVDVTTGVVARSRDGVYELHDGKLTLRPKLELPDQPLLGHWPGDVWYVETTPVDPSEGKPAGTVEQRLMQLDRDRRWVAQRYKTKKSWVGEPLTIRKGWLAGLLVRDGSNLTRVGSRKTAPTIGVRMGKVVLDTIETASGRLYNISLRPTGVHVQQACFKRSCVDEHAKKLPHGSEWTFSTQVPRQRNSLSVLATVDDEGTVAHQLLHYEIGGWSLESLVHAPSGLWAAPDGGLWMIVRNELRYRTAKGKWLAVALPEGIGKISKLSAAMRFEHNELWIAAAVGSETLVFATQATVAEPG